MEHSYQIEDIVDLEVFQEAMDRFFEATKYIRIGLKDPQGKTLLKAYRPGPEISPFCRLIRSSPEGINLCLESDRNGVLMAKEKKNYCIYRCKAGLVDFAIPLYCDDNFVGALMSGQIFLEPLNNEMEADILARCAHLPIKPDDLRSTLREINVIPPVSLEAILRLVSLFGQNIIDRELNIRRKTELYEERLRIAQEMQRAAELETNLNTARFETLQAQINPHFLFNALNTVARLSILENAPKSEKMAYAISRMLRYSLRRVDQPVTIADEIQQIATYLEIQKIRFQERLEFVIDISPSILKVFIPSLSLQPLVENALIHGLEPKMSPGKVIITGRRKQGNAIIVITDTGIGIPPEKLETIRKMERMDSGVSMGTGIGIPNVYHRLQHHFGDQMKFEINSQLNLGTQLSITFPI